MARPLSLFACSALFVGLVGCGKTASTAGAQAPAATAQTAVPAGSGTASTSASSLGVTGNPTMDAVLSSSVVGQVMSTADNANDCQAQIVALTQQVQQIATSGNFSDSSFTKLDAALQALQACASQLDPNTPAIPSIAGGTSGAANGVGNGMGNNGVGNGLGDGNGNNGIGNSGTGNGNVSTASRVTVSGCTVTVTKEQVSQVGNCRGCTVTLSAGLVKLVCTQNGSTASGSTSF